MLLSAGDEETGEMMNDQQVRDEVMTLLLAGHETTSAALTWTWYLISEHPEVEQRLHEEVDSVLATVAQRYCLRLVPGHPVEPQMILTTCPRHGLPMTLHPRENGAYPRDTENESPAPLSDS
jgi:cytochrome P450